MAWREHFPLLSALPLAADTSSSSSAKQGYLWREIILASLIAIAALAPRLSGLDLFLTADEPKSWFGRSIQFLEALAHGDWAATFDSPAPGVTTMWAGSLGLLLDYARLGFPGGSLSGFLAKVPFDPLDPAILPLIRLPVVLIATLTAVLTYWWGRAFLGQAGALLTALLLALDPFLLSLTRILGHDGLVTLFMWLSLVAFLRSINPDTSLPQRRFILISGVLGGLAFLSKYPSFFLGAFIALAILILHMNQRQAWLQTLKNWLFDLILWSAAAGFIFVLLWPVMWVDPVGRVIAIFSDALRASGSPHPKGSFFFGQPVPDPGPSFYALVTLFKTTPVYWLGWLLLIAVSLSLWLKRRAELALTRTILILLAFALLYALLMTVGGKKQDRYILPSFPALIALAVLGYTQLMALLKNLPAPKTQSLSKRYTWLLPALVFIQAVAIWPYHPYYFSYYAPALGGGPAAARLMIVGWGEGLDQAARWLNTQPDAHNLDVVAWYSTTFEPFFNGHAIYKIDEEKISRTPKPGLAADYVILYINQVQRELPSAGALQFFQANPPAHIVTLNGLDYAWIYPSVKLQRIIEDETRLVGQAELLGFNLLSLTGQPIQAIPSGQKAMIQLYWEWQGKALAEPIGLSLIDQNGQEWGQGSSLDTQARFPFEQWHEGMVAHDDFILEVFPGTPPGDYYLKTWIDRPATGELVGVFPLSFEDGHVAVSKPVLALPLADLPLTHRLETTLAGGQIKLLGLDSQEIVNQSWPPGQERELTLFWQANQAISQNYPITLALVDAGWVVRAEWSGLPARGRFPTDQWQAGDLVRDPWRLSLPAYVPPGQYQLTARLGEIPAVPLLSLSVEGRPRLFEPPPLDIALNTHFGDSIELLGLRQIPGGATSAVAIIPGQPLTLELAWYAQQLIETDYTLTIQLLDGQHRLQAQRDSMPLNGTAPTSSWAVGEVVLDPITLDIPAEITPGPYELLIAFYHFETGQRLPLPDGSDHLTIPVFSNQ